MALALSYSGATTWRTCQQRYWYRYEESIKPKVGSTPPLKLGNWIHTYLERYYKGLQRKYDPARVHAYALEYTERDYGDEIEALIEVALMVGEEDLAKEFQGLAALGLDICSRYFEVVGKSDAERYEIMLVEQRLNTAANDDLRVVGVVDLVVRDLERGVTQMWDHKSTGRIPSRGSHMLDMQEVLYAAMLHEQRGIQVDELLWNYLNTTPLVEPSINKDGSVSKRKDIDTTPEMYLAAIERQDRDPEDYEEVLTALRRRDVGGNRFQRHQVTLLPEAESVVIGDLIRTSEEIRLAKNNPSFVPVRNLGFNCNYCDFNHLCEAAVTGGDIEEIIARRYETPQKEI